VLVEQTLALMNTGARLGDIIHAVRPPEHLAGKPYLQPAHDEPEFVVRTVWPRCGGWYDGNPAHLKPAPESALAEALADLAGGADRLAERARTAAAQGDLRLATDLVELAAQATPQDPAIHAVRAELFEARDEAERSLVAQGVFRWTARSRGGSSTGRGRRGVAGGAWAGGGSGRSRRQEAQVSTT
jgi:alkyl sulfatase BDS1-like metallo-beta-lactamase superfamily hydrolase